MHPTKQAPVHKSLGYNNMVLISMVPQASVVFAATDLTRLPLWNWLPSNQPFLPFK